MSPEYMTADGCDKKHRETVELLQAINDRLYKDNGKKSIQSILNEHERILNVMCWVSGIVVVGLLGALGTMAVMIVRHVFIGG